MDENAIMRRVIELSRQGVLEGHGGPFGSVVVKDGEIVGEAHNELLAIRRAGKRLKTFNLFGCEIYTNGAPCCMCASSMLWARIARSYYILSMADSKAIGLGDEPFYDELARPLGERRIIPMIKLPTLRLRRAPSTNCGPIRKTRSRSD